MKFLEYIYRKPDILYADKNKLDALNIENIDSIAIHHMAHSTANIDEVCNWHMDDNGWSWIGYSYWIGFNGLVYECRGLQYIPTAVADNNNHIISIGFQGNYNAFHQMPDTQLKSGIELIKYLKSILPKVKTIDGHKHWNDTSCPGKYFPLDRMIKEATTMNVNEAILKLVSAGVIASPDYWLKAIDVVKNLDILLINMAKKL